MVNPVLTDVEPLMPVVRDKLLVDEPGCLGGCCAVEVVDSDSSNSCLKKPGNCSSVAALITPRLPVSRFSKHLFEFLSTRVILS